MTVSDLLEQPCNKSDNAIKLTKLVKPVTDEQVFYDKFLCDKFYLLVCTR
jgi:hypothetical protein